MKFIFRVVLALFLGLISLHAEASDKLLGKYKSELNDIEQYLQNIKFLTASFVQKTSDGGSISGKFYLSRPGKMRVEYNKPSSILIIVNNSVLAYQDLELEETSYLTTNSTPASFLTRENISFAAKDVELTDVKKSQNLITVSVQKKNKKEAGEFSLTFETNPIKFVKMEVENDLDQVTTVTFTDTNFGSKIDDKLFVVKDNKLPE